MLLLTVADIRAVGPGVWTGWKGQLLRTLYFETEPLLGGGHTTLSRSERVARAQDELTRAPGRLAEATTSSASSIATTRLIGSGPIST